MYGIGRNPDARGQIARITDLEPRAALVAGDDEDAVVRGEEADRPIAGTLDVPDGGKCGRVRCVVVAPGREACADTHRGSQHRRRNGREQHDVGCAPHPDSFARRVVCTGLSMRQFTHDSATVVR